MNGLTPVSYTHLLNLTAAYRSLGYARFGQGYGGTLTETSVPKGAIRRCEIQGRNDTGENWRTDTEMTVSYTHLDPMYHEKIDHLLDTYARKLAENMNQGLSLIHICPNG